MTFQLRMKLEYLLFKNHHKALSRNISGQVMKQVLTDKNIIFFDGVCNFCHSLVNFIIDHDKDCRFMFAPLQSGEGKDFLSKYNIMLHPDSVVYYEAGDFFTGSNAIIRILKKLGGFYSAAIALYIIPRFIRDIFYDLIARHRFLIFGKKDSCMIPDEGIKSRFIGE